MKPILKKILSYTAVAFLGFATGVGCLIGVSSCSQHNDHEEKQLNAIPSKKQLIITDIDTIIGSNKLYYAVAKNYANNGSGVFYDSSDINTGGVLSNDYRPPEQPELDLSLDIDVIDENSNISREHFFIFSYTEYTNLGNFVNYRVNRVGIGNSYIYRRIAEGGSTFNRQLCGFTFTKASYRYPTTTRTMHLEYFYTLFDIYDLSEPFNQYNFNSDFNYNNFYQVGDTFLSRGDSGVVNAVASEAQTKIYTLSWFFTGGFVFNQIKAYFYVTAYNYFQTHDNTWVKYESNAVSNYYLYFHHMEYVNSATNFTITACNRVVMPHPNESGWTDVYLECAWTNQDFKTIQLQDEITNIKTKSVFESLVSNILGGFTEINNDIDVGLGDVFSLISTAFSAWIPIFNIQIVPGVTIGLLLFLPLITGIIILIIWIVKR